jgi:rare lipoprotein A
VVFCKIALTNTLNKKSNNVIFFTTSIAFVSSQSTNLENKKAVTQKDTLKKNKATIELEESKTDSCLRH